MSVVTLLQISIFVSVPRISVGVGVCIAQPTILDFMFWEIDQLQNEKKKLQNGRMFIRQTA